MVTAELFSKVDRRQRVAGSLRLWMVRGLLVLGLFTFGACGLGSGSGEVEETVDVQEPIPSVDTSEDIQEAEREPELTGILPGDFPQGLPVYLPSSVVELGQGSVTLLSPHARQQVERQYGQALRDAGWSVAGEGAILELSQSGRTVKLVYAEGGPGTAYRIDY